MPHAQAVTATACAEQMAVATIVAYDIYKPYINKNADGRLMVKLQRITIVVYALVSGCVAVILLKLNVSLSWVYMFMGIVIGSAVFPIAASLTWAKCSATAACVSAVMTTPLRCGLRVQRAPPSRIPHRHPQALATAQSLPDA